MKDSYPKYVKNSYKSITKRQAAQIFAKLDRRPEQVLPKRIKGVQQRYASRKCNLKPWSSWNSPLLVERA